MERVIFRIDRQNQSGKLCIHIFESSNINNMSDIGESLYLPGAASLAEQIDSKILIVLRDGRTLMGILRSFDQYINLVMEETVERVTYEGIYNNL